MPDFEQIAVAVADIVAVGQTADTEAVADIEPVGIAVVVGTEPPYLLFANLVAS